ncbi:MAG: hypothetical protein Q8Q30_02920 [Candidatus Woesebacteria bacterium]|nr:hypothetical protein [Candidatus Woesebacteria bacterium]
MIDILDSARHLLQIDDSLTNHEDCRNVTIKLQKKLREEFPSEQINIIAYPEAKEGYGAHYALETEDDIINPIPAPGIPQYIGSKSNAYPIFSLFKKVDTVK